MIGGAAPLLMLLGFSPESVEPAANEARPSIATSIEFPLIAAVGPVRAGLLCLPRDKLRGRDFVRSERDFTMLVQQVASDSGADSAKAIIHNIKVSFRSLNVKLCAKSWGVYGTGDTKALSGTADFVFDWSLGDEVREEKHISRIKIDIGKDEAMPPDEIMREALSRLFFQISEHSH
jgi:hypothetical protein